MEGREEEDMADCTAELVFNGKFSGFEHLLQKFLISSTDVSTLLPPPLQLLLWSREGPPDSSTWTLPLEDEYISVKGEWFTSLVVLET